jgi:hypothetical protein
MLDSEQFATSIALEAALAAAFGEEFALSPLPKTLILEFILNW